MNIKKIIGCNFHKISRAVDMMCLGIGNEIDFVNNKGENVKRPQYAIHFQCPWRLYNENGIILGSYDIYEPFNKDIGDDWEYDLHRRPENESSVFDVTLNKIITELGKCEVTDCSLTKMNDLHISFTNDWHLDTFITSSEKVEEFWRFIEFETGEHTVIYDM
jgi:hypothetical protein